MEFSFTEEQQMIRDTAEAFLAEVSNSEAIRAAMATDQGYDPEIWQRICGEMYWQAIHIPEQYGGMGLGYVELVAIHSLPRTSSGKLSRAKARLDFINSNNLDMLDAAAEEVRLRVASA